MFEIACRRPWLIAQFSEPQRMVSWSLNRPGIVEADRVAWLEVTSADIRDVEDPAKWFAQRLASEGMGQSVGLMTARNVASHVVVTAEAEGVCSRTLITLGLNNGEHVGRRVDARLPSLHPGTINILCAVSSPLSDAALLEASSIVTQARTVALVEAGYRRRDIAEVVTGTGTDCIVMSAPLRPDVEPFAGMHTAIGEAVGASVYQATLKAAAEWIAARG
jgi:adenosylcobinamide amidohydrolase